MPLPNDQTRRGPASGSVTSLGELAHVGRAGGVDAQAERSGRPGGARDVEVEHEVELLADPTRRKRSERLGARGVDGGEEVTFRLQSDGDHVDQVAVDQHERDLRLEPDRRLLAGRRAGVRTAVPAVTSKLVSDDEEVLEREGHVRHRGAGRVPLAAHHLQERDQPLLGDLVDLEQQLLAHEGEQLGQRHPRVAVVEVGPLRGEGGDAAPDLGDDVLELSVVEIRGHERHGFRLPGGRRGRPGFRGCWCAGCRR